MKSKVSACDHVNVLLMDNEIKNPRFQIAHTHTKTDASMLTSWVATMKLYTTNPNPLILLLEAGQKYRIIKINHICRKKIFVFSI